MGGNVVGPELTTDEAIVRWNGADGELVSNSSVTIDDDGNIAGDGNISLDGVAWFRGGEVTVGENGSGGVRGKITLRDGGDPGTYLGITYIDWHALEEVDGLVKCDGSPGGVSGFTTITDNSGDWNDAHTHITSNGTDHGYINQDIQTLASPTFTGLALLGPTPILVMQDNNSAGAASVGYIEWKDSGGGRAGFFGNHTSSNDDLYWKNEQGGNIGIETTGTGELQIFADTVLDGNLKTGDGTANNTLFSTSGTQTMEGTARVYYHKDVTAHTFKPGGAQPTENLVGLFAVLSYSSSSTDEAYYTYHLQESWDVGTDIRLVIYWTSTTTDVGHVAWEVSWRARKAENDEVLDAPTLTVIEMHDDTQGLAKELQATPVGIISGGSLQAGDLVGIKVRRDHDDGDDYAGLVHFVHLEIQHVMDKLGLGL